MVEKFWKSNGLPPQDRPTLTEGLQPVFKAETDIVDVLFPSVISAYL